MSYMKCPCCGLTVHLRASLLALERCPRCLARRRAVVQMYLSEQPGGALEPAPPGDRDREPDPS